MGKVSVDVGGRAYSLSCADGEEDHLASLGAMLAAKADELTAAIGTMSEPRLLLMAGLQIADELVAARRGGTAAGEGPVAGERDDAALATILARVEALAATLTG